VNYGTIIAYITVNVQSEVTVLELEQHLVQNAFQQSVMDELIDADISYFRSCIFSTRRYIS